jgi:aminopeptidase N
VAPAIGTPAARFIPIPIALLRSGASRAPAAPASARATTAWLVRLRYSSLMGTAPARNWTWRWCSPVARSLVIAATLAAAVTCTRPAIRPSPSAPIGEPAAIEAGRAPDSGEYPRPFDVRHYEIELSLPSSGNRIVGTTEIRAIVLRGRPDTFPLDFTGLAVNSVHLNGVPVDASYRDGRLLVPLTPGTGSGQELRVRVDYAGTPDDGLIIRNNVHGRRTVFADNWPNRARFWFPAIDHPADKATVAFTIDAPAQWQVIANGIRRDTSRPDGPAAAAQEGTARRRWRWVIEEPISTYNMVVGAAEFETRTLGTSCSGPQRCVEVTTWLFPEDVGETATSFRRAAAMVDYFSGLIAPFPFGKLAHVQSSTRFGGMENATAIFYDEQALAKRRNMEGTVAHETAHQWFGNAVTPGDWPHLWLSEGFATYFGTLFFEHADGVEQRAERMEADRLRVIRSEAVARPVVDAAATDLFTMLNANSYQKGGWVLHMLRGLVGDRAFFDGIREYYRRHQHGTAVTDDFRRAMEAASGRGLEWFFDQWLFQPGFPRFRVTSNWNAAAGAADLVIEQTQRVTWPTFRTTMTVEVATDSGSVRRIIEIDERREAVRIALPAAPRRITLDPDGWVLKEIVEDGTTSGGSAGRL